MRTLLISLALALPLLSLPLAAHAQDDIDKINGAVRVEAGQHAGNVSTVNGSVHVDKGAVVGEATTVNGSVELGESAQAKHVETVNGSITLDGQSRVSGTVEAVNGRISLAQGAQVMGKLSNVSGTIELDHAHVAGGIETVAGDITIGADSRVEGGVLVEKNSGSWFSWGKARVPHIVIGPRAVVQGTLEFRREVQLDVSDSATIGPVKGATAKRFSGERP